MKKLFLFLLVLLGTLLLNAQDTSWRPIRIDQNLSVSIPKNTTQLDTVISRKQVNIGFKILKAETRFSTMGVSVTPNGTGIRAKDTRSLHIALDGFAKGMCEETIRRGFSCLSKDTLINKLPCKKFEISRLTNPASVIYNYSFLVNDRLYMFSMTPHDNGPESEAFRMEADRFLKSIGFTGSITEQTPPAKPTSPKYIIAALVLLLVAAGTAIYFVRK